MAYQQKEGQGSLFKNDKQNDRQPDFKGTIMIKGITYEVAAWSRTSQNGREYISLQASEKQAAVSGQGPYSAPTPSHYATPAPSQAPSGYSAPASYGEPQYVGTSADFGLNAPAPSLEDMPAADSEDLPF